MTGNQLPGRSTMYLKQEPEFLDPIRKGKDRRCHLSQKPCYAMVKARE